MHDRRWIKFQDTRGSWHNPYNGRYARKPWHAPSIKRLIVVVAALAMIFLAVYLVSRSEAAVDAKVPVLVSRIAPIIIHAPARPPARLVGYLNPTVARIPTLAHECMIQALYHEAGWERRSSLIRHLWTIAHRARRDDMPGDTICEVVFSPGEFSAFNNGPRAMRNPRMLARVTALVAELMPRVLPDLYGGRECAGWNIQGCEYTVADTIPTGPVTTHYYVNDAYFCGREGYGSYRLKGKNCRPIWANRMKLIGSEPCARVTSRPCVVEFRKAT